MDPDYYLKELIRYRSYFNNWVWKPTTINLFCLLADGIKMKSIFLIQQHDLRLKYSKQRGNLKVWSWRRWKRIELFSLKAYSNLKLHSSIIELNQ